MRNVRCYLTGEVDADGRQLCAHGVPVKTRPGRAGWECRVKARGHTRKWQTQNPDMERARHAREYVRGGAERIRRNYAARVALIEAEAQARGGMCQGAGCAAIYVRGQFHWHHRNPSEKSFSIGSGSAGLVRLRAELAKCDLLCADCHRLAHRLLRQG